MPVHIGFCAAQYIHGEEVVRSRCSPHMREYTFIWPELTLTEENCLEQQAIVATVDGAVAGRALLRAGYYPFAQFMGLEVLPAFRGRGLGSQIVDYAIEQAAARGYLALHLLVEYGNVFAQRMYARRGFVPADHGRYLLRMVRFLNYPALSQFTWEHPLATLSSRHGERTRELVWTDPLGKGEISIGFAGESRLGDGEGFGPGIHHCDIQSGDFGIRTTSAAPDLVMKGVPFTARTSVVNTGSTELSGACRLLLNSGFVSADGSPGVAEFHIAAGEEWSVELPIVILDSFSTTALEVCDHHSLPVGVEFFVNNYVFWLAKQVKLE